jgi:hypothetical protein
MRVAWLPPPIGLPVGSVDSPRVAAAQIGPVARCVEMPHAAGEPSIFMLIFRLSRAAAAG